MKAPVTQRVMKHMHACMHELPDQNIKTSAHIKESTGRDTDNMHTQA